MENGNYRNTYDILKDMSEKYEQLKSQFQRRENYDSERIQQRILAKNSKS